MSSHAMRVGVTGSRDWTDATMIRAALLTAEREPILFGVPRNPLWHRMCIIHGDSAGADAIAHNVAVEQGWQWEQFDADWNRFGNAAGPIRNKLMVDRRADLWLAFIGQCHSKRCTRRAPHGSHGTMGCLQMAIAAGIPVFRFASNEWTDRIPSHKGDHNVPG